jgi:hypothetical protein
MLLGQFTCFANTSEALAMPARAGNRELDGILMRQHYCLLRTTLDIDTNRQPHRVSVDHITRHRSELQA